MSPSRFELPSDRLATTDESGARVYLKPDVTRGKFYRIRQWVHPILIAIFVLTPWIKIGGEPLILLDIPHRRFTLFGTTFWAHDVPMLFFIFAIFSISIAFITAVWGRLWCGWACPQTVFIEGVFRKVERWIEGFERGNYRTSGAFPKDAEGWGRWLLKWGVFSLLALFLSHTFVAYFVGMDHLLHMMTRPPGDEPGWFLFMAIVTGIVLFDFGWFREQFCVIACPYGRIQSLFIDDESKLVAYDFKRGNPPRGTESSGEKSGDCVNCFRCVQVCPTGIDIRRGNQLECIACTACIDACDEVMEKVKKPKGLIRHASLKEIQGGVSRLFRPRTTIYLSLVAIAVGGFIYALSHHAPMDLVVLRAKGLPFQILTENEEKWITNHFHAEVWNGFQIEKNVSLSLSPSASELRAELIIAQTQTNVPPGKKVRQDFFIKVPLSSFTHGRSKIFLDWSADGEKQSKVVEVEIVGPIQ